MGLNHFEFCRMNAAQKDVGEEMAHILLISLAYLEQKKESREIKSFC